MEQGQCMDLAEQGPIQMEVIENWNASLWDDNVSGDIWLSGLLVWNDDGLATEAAELRWAYVPPSVDGVVT